MPIKYRLVTVAFVWALESMNDWHLAWHNYIVWIAPCDRNIVLKKLHEKLTEKWELWWQFDKRIVKYIDLESWVVFE